MESETIEMGLLELSCLSLSSFILIKENLVICYAGRVLANYICRRFFLLLIGFRSLPKIPKHKWKYIVMTSMFWHVCAGFPFALAQTEIDSSVTSILNSLTPLNTLVLGTLVLG
jgi:drug/metabolite transporter (DMT)-like permease